MLFNTWPFLIFLSIVLTGFFLLRKTSFWLIWLNLASYFFYGWANPYYLFLIFYITVLVFIAAKLMAQCPEEQQKINFSARLKEFWFKGRLLRTVFVLSTLGIFVFGGVAMAGPKTLLPFMCGLMVLMFFLAIGSIYSKREVWLTLTLVNALVPLLFFKYAQFFIDNLNTVLSWGHLSLRLPEASALMPFGLDYLLPLGISFFTFQSMGYLIDCYLEKITVEHNFLRFANFVCFFPQVMAGPIERADHLLPQFKQFPTIRSQNFADGFSLFLIGLFKKIVLASYLSLFVNRVYDAPESFSASLLFFATIAYAWQIYFDFSGYTDMARGVARLMGFDLVLNFSHPYLATGIGDFWRRWHMSFSRWILDYIFVPLQMHWRSWKGIGTSLALVVTFLVSGLWHGAAWTFVIWGLLHGLGLAATFGLERSAFYRKKIPKIVKQIWVFLFVSFTWIFFRANSVSDALLIVKRIFTATWSDPQMPVLMIILIALGWAYQFLCESPFQNILKTPIVRVVLAVLMGISLFFASSTGSAFIYLQF